LDTQNRQTLVDWYEGLISASASPEGDITPEQFSKAVKAAFGAPEEHSSAWVQFTEECVKSEQYVGFEAIGDRQTEVNRWLGTLLAELFQISHTHGEHAARQVCELAGEPLCLYPWEMDKAAQCLSSGGTAEDIEEMIESGEIVMDGNNFPKLGDNLKQGGLGPEMRM